MTNYVVGFAFNSMEDEVLLIQKNKPKGQNGLLNGVGGKIEIGETPLEAMARKFKEETDVDWEYWRHFVHYTDGKNSIDFFTTKLIHRIFYSAKSVTDETLYVATVYDMPINTISNLKWLIPLALDFTIHDQKPCIVYGSLMIIRSQIE